MASLLVLADVPAVAVVRGPLGVDGLDCYCGCGGGHGPELLCSFYRLGAGASGSYVGCASRPDRGGRHCIDEGALCESRCSNSI